MSSLSVMEWNAKPPLLWEWDSLVSFNSRAPEPPKTLHPADWGAEVEEGIDSGSLYSYGGNAGSSSTTSFDLGYASLSKGSKSPSLNSSSAEETKITKFSFEGREGYPEDFMGKKDLTTAEFTGTSPTLESSVCSGEPLLSLKLGKRAYPDDVCEGSNVQTTMNSSIAKSPDPPKKTKPSCQNTPAPRCQVEGCNLDLSSAKDYHRKHRVCEHHSKSPKVIVNGIERRFCQQCSRFHGLSEFDEKKRSCRKRLSDHNARRRKPQPDVTQLNSTRLSNMLYGGMQQVNHVVSTGPIMHGHYTDNLTWVNTPRPKFMHAKGKILNPAEAEDGNKHLHVPVNGLPNAVRPSGLNNGSSCLISFKAAANNVLGGGSEGSFLSSKLDAPRDNQRALSLLSTDPRDSCRPRSISHDHSFHRNDIGISMCQPSVYGVSQSSTLASPDYWHAGHRPNSIQTSNLTPLSTFGNDNNFDDCILPVARRDLRYDTVQLN